MSNRLGQIHSKVGCRSAYLSFRRISKPM